MCSHVQSERDFSVEDMVKDFVKNEVFSGRIFLIAFRVCQRNKEIYCEFSFLSLPDEAYASALLLLLLLKEYIC